VSAVVDAGPADLVIGGAGLVATMDADRRELAGGWVAVTDGTITSVSDGSTPEPAARRRIDARGGLVTPGLVNGHHHM
jgi:cytosine/adenosine deaminase-related metal-dependent hydrolase